jgi:hypothetical protein
MMRLRLRQQRKRRLKKKRLLGLLLNETKA